MQLKNRMVLSPMTTNYGNDDQTVSERLIAFHEARAKGGVGLITVEVCTVDVKEKYQPQSLTLGADDYIAGHRRLTDRMHQYGAKVQPQITHPGPESLGWLYFGGQSVGPSVVLGASTSVPSRQLEVAELDGIVEQYAQAARRAREAGYDGMELHAAHGYMLLGTFLSPVRNIRQDEYGAGTVENRTRMLTRVLRRIKDGRRQGFPDHAAHLGLRAAAGRARLLRHGPDRAAAGRGRGRCLPCLGRGRRPHRVARSSAAPNIPTAITCPRPRRSSARSMCR
jgi:2,4-dienoyl-CoA reductase (NADPH2)